MLGTANGIGMETNGIGLGEADGVLNPPRNRHLGTALGRQEKVLLRGHSMAGMEMHGIMIKEMAGVIRSPRLHQLKPVLGSVWNSK